MKEKELKKEIKEAIKLFKEKRAQFDTLITELEGFDTGQPYAVDVLAAKLNRHGSILRKIAGEE